MGKKDSSNLPNQTQPNCHRPIDIGTGDIRAFGRLDIYFQKIVLNCVNTLRPIGLGTNASLPSPFCRPCVLLISYYRNNSIITLLVTN